MSRRRWHGLRGIARVWIYLDGRERCAICGEFVAVADYTIDHRKPHSKGGTDARGNLQIAHRACNEAKGNREDINAPTV